MSIFKKRGNSQQEKIPKLPPLPSAPTNISSNLGQVPQIPAEQEEQSHSLPAYPDSNIGSEMSQNTIKEAVTEQPTEYQESEGYQNQEYEEPQMQQYEEPMQQGPMTQEYEESEGYQNQEYEEPMQQYEEPQMQEMPKTQTTKQIPRNEPLYIQLDKFENTIASFDQIKLQISEIEALLKHIKETRKKEEENLSNWETEIEQIRSKLEKIDKDIFSQV